MEIAVGAALAWVAVAIFVAALRRLRPIIERDVAHEAWCASRPVLLALSCRSREDAVRVRTAIAAAIGPAATLVNSAGRRPHASYRMRTAVELVHGTVVRVVACSARRLRAAERPTPDTRDLLAVLGAPQRSGAVAQIWLHGELWEGRHAALDRARLSWRGVIENDGTLALEEMIGRATWVDHGPDGARRRAA